MKKLALFALAAGLSPSAAYAQDQSAPPPPPPEAISAAEASAQASARYRDYQRLERGASVPQHWWGPAFIIGDWNAYGLYQPMPGHRWIRYYDDALLIDAYGRVWDGRYGMDWTAHQGWTYDERGIPVYAEARGDAYGLGHHGGHASGYTTYHHGGQPHAYTYSYPAYAYPAYGYGYAGYGYGGGWITETTVTYSSDCCCEEAAVVEQPYVPPPPPPPLPPPPPPPPPPPGERG